MWTAAGEAATPTDLGGSLVDDALSPPPAGLTAGTTKEFMDKLLDGDSVPIYLLLQLEAAVRPKPAAPDDGQHPASHGGRSTFGTPRPGPSTEDAQCCHGAPTIPH